MKIYSTDSKVTVLAKKAAMICQYTPNHNPLHCYFEDGNVHGDAMDNERRWNDLRKDEYGQKMYDFINEFLDEFEPMDLRDRRLVYRMFRKKWDYLDRKWMKKIRENSKPHDRGVCGVAYKHYLAEDGHIYVKTDMGVELMQF